MFQERIYIGVIGVGTPPLVPIYELYSIVLDIFLFKKIFRGFAAQFSLMDPPFHQTLDPPLLFMLTHKHLQNFEIPKNMSNKVAFLIMKIMQNV